MQRDSGAREHPGHRPPAGGAPKRQTSEPKTRGKVRFEGTDNHWYSCRFAITRGVLVVVRKQSVGAGRHKWTLNLTPNG